MERIISEHLFIIIGCLLLLFLIITILLILCELFFQYNRRTSAKIHPEKNETIVSKYKTNINPMFLNISN